MDITTAVKLPIHKHPLTFSPRFFNVECGGCHVHEIVYGVYYCNEPNCYIYLHKKCGEAPSEINHPSHSQHPLLLITKGVGDGHRACCKLKRVGDGPCALCGVKLLAPYYSCPTCDFKVDLSCWLKPPSIAIEHPLCHDHPLVFLKKRDEQVPCDVCKDSIAGPSYSCIECVVYFHVGCIHFSKEVNHPCHSPHPLKLVASSTLTDDAQKACQFCDQEPENVLYHCSICNFTICPSCTKNPPPLAVEHTKTHEHPLSLIPKKISFTCEVCGFDAPSSLPYLCLQCPSFSHGSCIATPRVININRHDHRLSFTHHLGHKHTKCGVCRESVSQYYGAYSCSVCPSYAVHSRCARRPDIWDGKELEGFVNNDDNEDIAPFKVVGDNLISHFSHDKHTLRLHNNNIIRDDEGTRCEACNHLIVCESIYKCEECCFVLHEKCANLPMKKRLVFGIIRYELKSGEAAHVVHCKLCNVFSSGFRYTCPSTDDVDVHCASLSEPFVHDGHLHPLYFDKKKGHICDACKNDVDGHVLHCDACDFDLCLYCASLPLKISHRNDGHPLTLSCGEEASGKYWCDICERELDPSKWFYTCYDCGVTLHVRCVLGDFSRLKPGLTINFCGKYIFEVVLNNHNTRPLCGGCHSRCKVSVILKSCHCHDNTYICSHLCLVSFIHSKFV